jgi:hypothetical protein
MINLTPDDIEALAATTHACRKIADEIPPENLPPTGEWYRAEATLVPDPDGDFYLDGVCYSQRGPTRISTT